MAPDRPQIQNVGPVGNAPSNRVFAHLPHGIGADDVCAAFDESKGWITQHSGYKGPLGVVRGPLTSLQSYDRSSEFSRRRICAKNNQLPLDFFPFVFALKIEIWRPNSSSWPPHLLMMKSKFQQAKKPDDALRSLNTAIDAMDLARDNATLKPATDSFHSASALLTTIRVCFLPFHHLLWLTGIRRTP